MCSFISISPIVDTNGTGRERGCHIADLSNVDAFHNSRNHKTVIADKHRLLQLTEQAVSDNTQGLTALFKQTTAIISSGELRIYSIMAFIDYMQAR